MFRFKTSDKYVPGLVNETSVIEVVISPNNPSGDMRTPIYPDAQCIIHDHASYLWPFMQNVS